MNGDEPKSQENRAPEQSFLGQSKEKIENLIGFHVIISCSKKWIENGACVKESPKGKVGCVSEEMKRMTDSDLTEEHMHPLKIRSHAGGDATVEERRHLGKKITQTQPKNPSTVSLHHRRKEWHTAAVRLQPLFPVTDRGCFLELGVRRLCLLSRASVAVCLPFTFASSFSCRLRSRSSPFTVEFAFVFGSHVALLQTLRPTRALHLAVELFSFIAAVSSLNPPPDNTLTQHQYSASNSATSDFYYNK
ncbi:hypothetical protein Ahy_A04g020455 isoform E [Arachis hypogaea]|uniref:Uncharacterized protein n=1 Tax=Arachis hypogaea TaxID=3818 RepID=A0A445DHN3_ARAHY|nr:hypothetical protein Ahy_A04g020455 isoform E [Arachis hypogaea]